MYHCNYIPNNLRNEWNALVAKTNNAGFQQTFYWSDFLEKTGWTSHKIGLFDEKDNLVGGAIIYKFYFKGGYSFLHIPEGPIINYEDVETAQKQWQILKPFIFSFIDLSKYIKTTHLRIEPRLKQEQDWIKEGFQRAPWTLSPRTTQIIDLKKDENDLLKAMKQKTRYNIHLAEKKGVKIEDFEIKNKWALKQFFMLYQKTVKNKEYEGKNWQYFRMFSKKYPNSKIFIAMKDEKPLAAAITINCGERSTYLFGGSDYKERALRAPYLLHWAIIKDVKLKGFLEYDFWGTSKNPHDQNDEWYGITKFKMGFGGQPLNLITSLDLVLQMNLYKKFVERYESV